MLTTDQKGAIAELAIAKAATELGIDPDTERCYFLPYDAFPRRTEIRSRLSRSRNNQRLGVNWAENFEFAATLGRVPGAIAQLGERVHGMHEVAGSSPAGSTLTRP
jgi:hypothetical protein